MLDRLLPWLPGGGFIALTVHRVPFHVSASTAPFP